MELPEHGHEFIASIQAERGLSSNTAAAYARDLTQYHKTILACRGRVDEQTVRTHLRSLREAELASSSIARKLASIRAYHRFLITEDLASDDPTASIDSLARPIPLPKALSIDEASLLVEAPDDTTPIGRRDRAILEALYATGCRVSEVVGLDLHDIDFETGTALVTGKGNRERIVPLGSYASRAIQAWLEDRLEMRRPGADPGALFLTVRGNRLSRQSVWRLVRSYGTQVGIDASRLSPHVLRHSAATHMVEGGADLRTVQEMLGHASLSSTQVYTKVTPQHLREIVVTSHPRGI
ncbi:MAG: site-specific tyrosine recombinase XerD [Acidimicrobiia bacterium]|nr:MAG: site-specific tyrosine recombinase XerD [Acidimicrobiia bacterium]